MTEDGGVSYNRVVAGIGDRVEITLQDIGPGEYGAPPAISSDADASKMSRNCGMHRAR
jgi:hypothetical protein